MGLTPWATLGPLWHKEVELHHQEVVSTPRAVPRRASTPLVTNPAIQASNFSCHLGHSVLPEDPVLATSGGIPAFPHRRQSWVDGEFWPAPQDSLKLTKEASPSLNIGKSAAPAGAALGLSAPTALVPTANQIEEQVT